MKKLFLLLATVAAIFTACEGGLDNEENGGVPSTPKIELSQQSIEVEFESAQHSVSVTSPYSWEAISKNDWIVVDTEDGIAGTETLKFSVLRNEEEQERKGTIVLKNTDYNLVAELYVIQKAFVPEITVGVESLTFATEGGEQEIAVTANFEYEFSTNADWLTIEKSENGLKVTVPNYVEVENRTADITISNEKYSIAKVVTVTQGALVPEITVGVESLTFEFKKSTQEVTITANFEYEWSTNADWLTIEKSKNGVNITATINAELEERTAEVAILSEKYGISKVVTVTQGAFVPEITVGVESLTFECKGGSQEVTITANFEYKVSKNANWLTIEKSENGLKVTAPNYVEVENRTAEITISNEKYGITKTISATQKGVTAEYAIFYTSSNNKIVTPYKSDVFGAKIVYNIYANGKGAIIFNAPVTSIGEDAFNRCTSLTSITIPDSVTSIGSHAFYYCDSLTSVTIPNSVTSIGHYAFRGCTSLTSVTIGNSVTSIGSNAFWECTSLTSVTIPDSVTSIGGSAFKDCTSLTSVTIGNSVTSIGSNAFYYCRSLTSVTIGNSVTSIGDWAFRECKSLTSVTIPDSVTSIGYQAFYYCTSLKSVYCKPTTPPSGDYYMFDSNASGRMIYVPRNSESVYESAQYWSDYAWYIVGYDFL